jgi:hypothetical protein
MTLDEVDVEELELQAARSYESNVWSYGWKAALVPCG